LSLGALYSITAAFRASAAVATRLALPSAGSASFRLAQSTLLIELLLSRTERKRLATTAACNRLIRHLEQILQPVNCRLCLSSFSSAFISAAAVTGGLTRIPAIFTAPWIAHIALLVKLLLARRERKCSLAIGTFDMFIFHVGFLGL
jgi:hypothetical protein